MFTKFRVPIQALVYNFLALVGAFSLCIDAGAAAAFRKSHGVHIADPHIDIPWKTGLGYAGVEQVRTAFNHARTQENSQLGTDLPLITSMPHQTAWDALTDSEKALWLVNNERYARGLHPLHGIESNVSAVAQEYAQWMIENDRWGHNADGAGPPGRLGQNPAIAACHDNFLLMENLYAFGTTAGSIPLPVERALYNWVYNDSNKGWGHRHLLLYHSFFENNAPFDREGLMGIGRASGGPYTINGRRFPFAEVIVLNMFDPCKNWAYNSSVYSPAEYFLRYYSS